MLGNVSVTGLLLKYEKKKKSLSFPCLHIHVENGQLKEKRYSYCRFLRMRLKETNCFDLQN